MTTINAPFQNRTAFDIMWREDNSLSVDEDVLRDQATVGDKLSQNILDTAHALDQADTNILRLTRLLTDRCDQIASSITQSYVPLGVPMPFHNDAVEVDGTLIRKYALMAQLRGLIAIYVQRASV